MPRQLGPLLTRAVADSLGVARRAGRNVWTGSLDLERSQTRVQLDADAWHWHGRPWPYPEGLKDRSIYVWQEDGWQPVQRYSQALVKLVPSEWGAPTFEIDGIKMLPTARVSPFEDARTKAALVAPRGKRVLDTCGGLGYYAAACLDAGVARIDSFEKNPDVLWLRTLNPWSPDADAATSLDRLVLTHQDISSAITQLPNASVDAILHDPPRFGIAGELYSLAFYEELARVIRPGGPMFHYTGNPNQLTSGRDVPREVTTRLRKAGFDAQAALDGVLAVRRRTR
ncbi:MAG: SAM-dependent methyltransferase [Xanthomonadales bacterium]|nr:SAM-dependent methyltransferase [Xanthomonadales bacterium]